MIEEVGQKVAQATEPIPGRPCRRWQRYAGDQPQRQSRVGVHPLPSRREFFDRQTTVERLLKNGPTCGNGGDGGCARTAVRMHDVGPRTDNYYCQLLRRIHHRILRRVIGYRRMSGKHRQLFQRHTLQKMPNRGRHHPDGQPPKRIM